MTVYRFNVVKEKRKALVAAMSVITGYKPIYKKAPTFEYVVGDYKVSADGCVTAYGTYNEEELTRMVEELVGRGFNYETNSEYAPEASAPDDEDECTTISEASHDNVVNDKNDSNESIGEDMLSIEMPLDDFSTSALSNLQRMVSAKSWLIKLMTGTDNLPIENVEGRLHFPWFKKDSSAEEVNAYSHLITRLCETAKTKRRVTAEERLPSQDDNVKYKGRCFLLSLGFIGPEYSQARKLLLLNLPGNGSFLQGNRKKEPVAPIPISNDDVQNNQEAMV